MTVTSTHFLNDLGPQAQLLSKKSNNKHLGMILHFGVLGSMVLMARVAASQVLVDPSGSSDRDRGRSR